MVEYYVALTLNLFSYRSARHGQYYACPCSGSRIQTLARRPAVLAALLCFRQSVQEKAGTYFI